ncbi:MAG TPA: hypothetical protein VGI43_08275 [Mucilaginibacter sp.]|jgi:hypothetical protein
MKLKDESIEFRDKVMDGVNKAVKKLVIAAAEKNEKLVIADKDGNVQHVPAKDLLKTLPDNDNVLT